MICSSVNRFFMSNLLHGWDWTLKLRATQTGGTSASPFETDYLGFQVHAGHSAQHHELRESGHWKLFG